MEYIDIVFDGPPSPEGARFVEVEDSRGKSIDFGEWVQRPDGYWALRIRIDSLRTNLPKPKAFWSALHELHEGHRVFAVGLLGVRRLLA
jgi:hypothetical protein